MEASAPPQLPLLATSSIGAGWDSHPCLQLCEKDLPSNKFVSVVVVVVFLVVYQKYFSGCLLESSLLMPKTTTTVYKKKKN